MEDDYRMGEGETEFVTISYWESLAAMVAFAGADPTRVRHLERDAEFIELPKAVQILRVLTSHGVTGSGASNGFDQHRCGGRQGSVEA